MRPALSRLALASAALLAAAASPPPAVPAAPFGYADLVDLALAAPVVARVHVDRTQRVDPEQAPGLRPGAARLYVEATVTTLVRGAGGMPAAIAYLVDLPADAHGRPPKIKGADALLFAARVPAKPGELRLISPNAELPWTPAAEQTVRAVLTQALGPDAPPQVTGVGQAFHVAGTLPGESETQIFLRTADHRPVSLSVSRHPDQAPRWAVALSDIIDEAAAPPARDTLLWYRLACALPARLPDTSVADLGADDAEAARADYQVVLRGLGPCGRERVQAPGGAADESVTPTESQSG